MSFSTETKKIINDRFKELPGQIIELIDGGELQAFFSELQSAQQISEENMIVVENEVLFVLLTYEPIEKLYQNIADNSSLQDDAVAAVVREVVTDGIVGVLPILAQINLQQEKMTYDAKVDEENVAVMEREKLQLRPENLEGAINEEAKPISKEELVSSIATSRTMKRDVAAATGEPVPEPVRQESNQVAAPDHAPTIKSETPVPPPTINNGALPYQKPLTNTPSYNNQSEGTPPPPPPAGH